MSGNNISSGNELPMDVLLQAAASELPPPVETVDEVSPWKRSVKRILLGLALTTIKLNFLMLNYLLPLIGLLLLLLGFRSLRRENRHFRTGYGFSLAHTVLYFVHLTLNATIWRFLDPLAQIIPFISYLGILITLGIVICLRNGFVSVQRKAGVPVDAGNATALVVWYIVLSLSGIVTTTVTDYIGTFQHSALMSICTGSLLIIYICILISYYRQSMKIMDCSGYAIEPAPVRLSSRTFCLVLSGILLLLMTVAYVFFNQYPMHWTEVRADEHAQVEEIKAELLTLDFPEQLLNAMTTEDILACEDAVLVEVDDSEHALKGRKVTTTEGNTTHITTVAISIVSVKLAEDHQWKFFYYFEWLIDPDFYRTDAVWILPVYMYDICFRPVGETGFVSGRLLYDQNGVTYRSDYYHCTYSPVESSSLDGTSVRPDIVAGFSFPRGGEHYRGYLSYRAEQIHDAFNINTWFSYYTPSRLLQYPVVPADQMQHPFLSLSKSSTYHMIDHVGMFSVKDEE